MESLSSYLPGQEYVLGDGDEAIVMVLLGKFSGMLWFNNGFSYPEGSDLIRFTGNRYTTFRVSLNIWTTFGNAGLIGNLTDRNPGDTLLVFSSDHLEVSIDTIMVKDSPRQMIISTKGRIMSFVGGLYLWTGFTEDVDTLERTPEALSLLHQLYD